MDYSIFFKINNNDNNCAGRVYNDFIDYAFSESDYFMLVYVNYYGKGYTKNQKYFMKALEKYKVKRRTNPSWPGTEYTETPFNSKTTYKIVFYRTDQNAKSVLKEVNKLSDWSRPSNPEDLAFFKSNQCWFYSVGHESIAGILHATERDFEFLERNKLANRKDAEPFNEEFYYYCNEKLDG